MALTWMDAEAMHASQLSECTQLKRAAQGSEQGCAAAQARPNCFPASLQATAHSHIVKPIAQIAMCKKPSPYGTGCSTSEQDLPTKSSRLALRGLHSCPTTMPSPRNACSSHLPPPASFKSSRRQKSAKRWQMRSAHALRTLSSRVIAPLLPRPIAACAARMAASWGGGRCRGRGAATRACCLPGTSLHRAFSGPSADSAVAACHASSTGPSQQRGSPARYGHMLCCFRWSPLQVTGLVGWAQAHAAATPEASGAG